MEDTQREKGGRREDVLCCREKDRMTFTSRQRQTAAVKSYPLASFLSQYTLSAFSRRDCW